MVRTWTITVLAVISLAGLSPGLFSAGTAEAHKASIYAYAAGGRVDVEAYFASGARCGGCTVEVLDGDGGTVLTGTTDREGSFSFAIPGSGPLTLRLHAGPAHAGEYRLSAAEVEAALGAEPAASQEGEDASAAVPSVTGDIPSAVRLERMLDARLRPLEQEVRKLREAVERPGLAEIVGGVGWIAGLAALVYAWKRRGRG